MQDEVEHIPVRWDISSLGAQFSCDEVGGVREATKGHALVQIELRAARHHRLQSRASDAATGALLSLFLIVEQPLNGLQFGLMLFLLAAGLTLVFGIMDMINLAHGSLYMVGAFIAAAVVEASGSFLLGDRRRDRRHGAGRHGARNDAAAPALSARPPLAGARDLRADPDPQRDRAHDLGQPADPAHTPSALSGPVELLPASAIPPTAW